MISREIKVVFENPEDVVSIRGMFYGCKEVEEIDISNLNMLKLKDMSSVFGYCRRLKGIRLKGIVTSGVTNGKDNE